MKSKFDDFCCPLCNSKDLSLFCEDKNRIYLRCFYCKLVFVHKSCWLSFKDEKAVYDLHENNVQDQGYRQFLSRLTTPLLEKLSSKQNGLDFGCGPGPTLSVILEEQGHQVDLYDPIYYKDLSVFYKKYDFICATEVAEHLQDPDKEFSALFKMLKKNGWLGIMTKLVTSKDAFSQWHYIRDMTHICFYSQTTFEYIAQRFNAELKFAAKDVILFSPRS